MKTAKVFMAFSAGSESKESAEIKRYVGIAPVSVLAVNPSKAELEQIYNTEIENEPSYISTTESNGKQVPTVRLDFIIKTDESKCGVNLISKAVFFIKKDYRFNNDKTKVQVIDKYGRTAWVTQEELKEHKIPMYSNGPANLDKDYRPIYIGEDKLTDFIKMYLNIPEVMRYVDKQWVMSDKPEDSEARFDNLDKLFTNDFSELKTIIKLQPNNKIKVMFGVRTTNEGKIYQAVYTDKFLRHSATKYDNLVSDLEQKKSRGGYPSTEFFVGPIKEYSVKETDFSSTNSSTEESDDMPDFKSPFDL